MKTPYKPPRRGPRQTPREKPDHDGDDGEDEESLEPNRSLASDHRIPGGLQLEDGPGLDPEDPNLSALFAETGVEERLNELGL
jgi:hypothetical protein